MTISDLQKWLIENPGKRISSQFTRGQHSVRITNLATKASINVTHDFLAEAYEKAFAMDKSAAMGDGQ